MSLASHTMAILLAILSALLGTAKMVALAQMRGLAAEIGLPVQAYRRIGLLEATGAAGLLVLASFEAAR
jgi:hypothetical protein